MKYPIKYFYYEIKLFRIYAEIIYVTLQHIHISIYSSTYIDHIRLFSWVRKSYMWKNVRHIWRALVIYEISPFHTWNFIWHIWKLSRCIYDAYMKIIKLHICVIYAKLIYHLIYDAYMIHFSWGMHVRLAISPSSGQRARSVMRFSFVSFRLHKVCQCSSMVPYSPKNQAIEWVRVQTRSFTTSHFLFLFPSG